MNNPIPFFNPYQNIPLNNGASIERLEEKIERLEKNISILTNRIKKLEQNYNKHDNYTDDSTDMYMI